MFLVFIALVLLGIGLLFFLWKTGRIELNLGFLCKEQVSALEFLKLPQGVEVEENEVKGVELIHFKGVNGLELLTPPPLSELKKGKEKNFLIKPIITLLTGRNLTGYFLLLTKMLFLMEKHPVFLVIKERDLERFKRHSNITISIFKQKNTIDEEIKFLRYQFLKGLISEEEFKKRIMELGVQKEKSPVKERLYNGYTYFSSPSEIIRDIGWFILKTKHCGVVVMTMLDEMMLRNEKKTKEFLESLTRLCTQRSTPLILTFEQGVFPKEINNSIRSYCDMIFETKIENGRRYVTVYGFEKVFSNNRVSEVSKNYKQFLKRVGFLEER